MVNLIKMKKYLLVFLILTIPFTVFYLSFYLSLISSLVPENCLIKLYPNLCTLESLNNKNCFSYITNMKTCEKYINSNSTQCLADINNILGKCTLYLSFSDYFGHYYIVA